MTTLNQTPEWRALTAALSGYRLSGHAKPGELLDAADIIGVATLILQPKETEQCAD